MLKELGWVEGGNLTIEQRYSHSEVERYSELAVELVRLKVDILVTDGSAATKAAQQATTTIPIVFVSGDPIARGFVASLARPGGNLTGVALISVGRTFIEASTPNNLRDFNVRDRWRSRILRLRFARSKPFDG